MGVAAAEVKTLRERTGAGMMECKRALEQSDGDLDRAVEVLRARGQAKAAKRSGREAAEGVIGHYVHADGRLGALVEINCETDFVARSAEFREFTHEVAVQVAAAAPRWVSDADVPEDVKAAELALFERQAEDKPADVRPKIAQGRLRKWLEEVVLLNQPHVNRDKHEDRTVEELRAELAARTGENVVVKRFARLQVGG